MSLSPAHPASASPSPYAMLRRLVLGLTMALGALLATAPAVQAATPAEQFVQTNVDKGLKILNNKTLNDSERRAQFRTFLISLTDIRRTALFTLGAARRTASHRDIDRFVDAFRNYAIAVYQTRLSAYSGQTLKVTGSTERAPGDYVVTTLLVDPSGDSGDKPIQVDFRVDKTKGSFKVLDASVVGVWLAIEERDQFSAFLAQHNSSVPALTRHLNELAKKLETSPPPQASNP